MRSIASIASLRLAGYAQQHGAQAQERDQTLVSQAINDQNDSIEGSGKLGEFAAPHLLVVSLMGIEGSAGHSIPLHKEPIGEHGKCPIGNFLRNISKTADISPQNRSFDPIQSKINSHDS